MVQAVAAYAGLASVTVGIYGYIPYVISVCKGKAQPDRAAWLIWTMEYAVIFAALATKQTPRATLALAGAQGLGVAVVFLLAMWKGSGRFNRLTGAVFFIVTIALVIRWRLSYPLAALIIVLAVETTGIVFVVVKTLREPESETYQMWLCASLAGLFGVVAVAATPGVSPAVYLYPAVLMVINMAVVVAKVYRSAAFRFVIDKFTAG